MLQVRKLYVDCVTPAGEVYVVYLSSLRALGLQLAPAGIESYDASGTRTILRGRA